MAYVWINPVVARMYEPEILNTFLCLHGYKRFDVNTDWLAVVKEKYRFAVEDTEDTVVDVRCPRTRAVLEELGVHSAITFPEIHPILIHCGQEGSKRADLLDDEKIITTPCQALADMGNALGLEHTFFVTWKSFLESIGEQPKGQIAKESPIPTGFFAELGVKTASVTGETEIREYFKDFSANEVDLVELLYCKDGCHNGDGIIV